MLNLLKDVFSSLEKRKVEYVVIGGIAAVLHGVPRATFDLDVLINPTSQNVKVLLEALLEANLGTAALTSVSAILENEITIFQDRVRIDVQTSTPGLLFEDAWANKVTMHYQGQRFYVVSLDGLISSKLAAGRKVDLEDVSVLKLLGSKKN